jgi:hypothetical protein
LSNEVVATVNGVTIVMLSCSVAFWGVASASATCAVKVAVPAADGIPEINPLLLKLNPAGKVPEATLQA